MQGRRDSRHVLFNALLTRRSPMSNGSLGTPLSSSDARLASTLTVMISVRQYVPSDHGVCRDRLWVQLTQHHRDLYDAQYIGGDDPGADFDKHLALVGPERLWVAEIEGQLVGLTGLIVTEESSEIEPVIVDAEYRRRGVATALIDHLKVHVSAQGLPELIVRPVGRNSHMLEFMSKQGFNTIGQVELIIREDSGGTKWVDDAEVSGVRFLV